MLKFFKFGKKRFQQSTEVVQQKLDEYRSKQINISDVNTVCLCLGPYRNLTTLTASIVMLHPNCQVLNHAQGRILGNPNLNFLAHHSDRIFNNFVRYAIFISQGGQRGDYGGSILFSHAFDPKYKTAQLYQERYGDQTIKDNIYSLFWKESLIVSNFIRDNNVNINQLLSANQKLKFLMPIRNPLDCAVSNKKTGHINRFRRLNYNSSIQDIVTSILNEFLWFLELHKQYPEKFFYYFENHSNSQKVLQNMAAFLEVEAEEQWLDQAQEIFKTESQYIHPPELVNFYHNLVSQKFSDYPEITQQLLEFK